jgi:hypothetical protein
MLFSRDPPGLDLAALLPRDRLRALVAGVPPESARRADHVGAHARAGEAIAWLHARGEHANAVAEFARAQATWLDRDATLAAAGDPTIAAQYRLAQYLLHAQHHALLSSVGLKLYGDMQIGISQQDSHWLHPLFLSGYKLGAPPSRTNPDGQPWNYPVLDPAQYSAAVGALVELRADVLLGAYDGLRIDHPHGLVDPWVYRDTGEPLAAVQSGARLFSSPDLPDHPRLARFAIARRDQLDVSLPRHHDNWVATLESTQVSQYAALFDRFLQRARNHGRQDDDLMCEVLSTWPHPLRSVMERAGLGRLVVTQKANLDDARDVYRSENAAPQDWIMLGNHDTQPIWNLVERWHGTAYAGRRAAHLAERLQPDIDGRSDFIAELVASPDRMATALCADLFASRARHVSIFFSDLLGYRETYNIAGVVSDENWRLRVAPDWERQYERDLASDMPRALDLPRALALALNADPARRTTHRELHDRLQSLAR